jgi:hypothetical protein
VLFARKLFREGTYPANLLGGIRYQWLAINHPWFFQENYFVKELTPVKRVLNKIPVKRVLKRVPQSFWAGLE